jgi:hypothetical protein
VHSATLIPVDVVNVPGGNGNHEGEMHTAATFHATASRQMESTSSCVASGASNV